MRCGNVLHPFLNETFVLLMQLENEIKKKSKSKIKEYFCLNKKFQTKPI